MQTSIVHLPGTPRTQFKKLIFQRSKENRVKGSV